MTKEKEHIPKRWVGCSVEADYLGENRKHGKQERKMATSKDRSKHKKTDRDKLQRAEKNQRAKSLADNPNLSRGRVLSITPQGIMVDFENQTICCFLRGVLKKEKGLLKNLVAVGDFVLFEKTGDEGIIIQVEDRRSYLSRADNLSQRKEQLIATNIDQVIITVSVGTPPLKPSLVDRYIIATLKGNMEPIIVINKIDLLDSSSEEEKGLYEEFIQAHEASGVPVIPISVVTGQGVDKLKEAMTNKASVFSGQSGVGKTSLINAIAGLNMTVGDVVEKTQKGSHTTTRANLLRLTFGGWVVDTPGIKSFGVWDLTESEIMPYFNEIYTVGQACKYQDCSHLGEAGCAVVEAIEKGEISALRYLSYRQLIESIRQEHIRR
jgi:ribosome biogenesis GTPase